MDTSREIAITPDMNLKLQYLVVVNAQEGTQIPPNSPLPPKTPTSKTPPPPKKPTNKKTPANPPNFPPPNQTLISVGIGIGVRFSTRKTFESFPCKCQVTCILQHVYE